MTMQINIKDQYLSQFETLLKSLPSDAIEIKKSLDDEINKRVNEYKSEKIKTVPFGTGFDKIKEKLEPQI